MQEDMRVPQRFSYFTEDSAVLHLGLEELEDLELLRPLRVVTKDSTTLYPSFQFQNGNLNSDVSRIAERVQYLSEIDSTGWTTLYWMSVPLRIATEGNLLTTKNTILDLLLSDDLTEIEKEWKSHLIDEYLLEERI